MNNIQNKDILAEIRTLLALERNYLAEERTFLAELRTGIALALIGAPLSTLIAYLFPDISIVRNLVFNIILIGLFVLMIIVGFIMIIRARNKIKETNKEKELLQGKIRQIIKKSPEASELFEDLILLIGETSNINQ